MWSGTRQTNGATANRNAMRGHFFNVPSVSIMLIALILFSLLIMHYLQAHQQTPWLHRASPFRTNFSSPMVTFSQNNIHHFLKMCNCFFVLKSSFLILTAFVLLVCCSRNLSLVLQTILIFLSKIILHRVRLRPIFEGGIIWDQRAHMLIWHLLRPSSTTIDD